jgi:hypothetical protein
MENHGGRKKTKKSPKSYDVQVKQTYFWANQGQPTPYPLQNLIHVSLTESPMKIEENCIFRTFLNKNSPRAHTESELGVLGVPGKLGKNLVHGCKKD